MRATLNIDDALLEQVMKLTDSTSRSEAIRIALVAYIKSWEKQTILAMRGNVDMDDNWRMLRALDMPPS